MLALISVIKFPKDASPSSFNPVSNLHNMKVSHHLFWLSEMGVYLMCLLIPNNEHRKQLIRLIRWCYDIRSITIEKSKLNVLQEEIVDILARLEFLLPPYYHTVNHHLALHLLQQIQRYGCLPYTWTLSDEVIIYIYIYICVCVCVVGIFIK